jgi:hypothetical protein
MIRYNEVDLSFYQMEMKDDTLTVEKEGDLILGLPDQNGLIDIKVTDDYESARQDISNRIRTQTGDWRSHPKIGGDLELLEGEPNTRETAMKGSTQIMSTLTYDGRFQTQDVQVRPVPTNIYQIDYFVFLDAGEEKPLVVNQSMNL